MNRDRLATLVRVRELLERRRLAEQAAATRAVEDAEAARRTALAARAANRPPVGALVPAAALTAARCGALALDDAVTMAATEVRQAERQLAIAERRTVTAAIQRRSAERLHERRAALAADEQGKRDDRRADEVALQVWRRR